MAAMSVKIVAVADSEWSCDDFENNGNRWKRTRDPINIKTHHEEIYSNKKRLKTVNEKVENDILQIATDYR